MLILLGLTLIFGKGILPEWLQDRVTTLEGYGHALIDPVRKKLTF